MSENTGASDEETERLKAQTEHRRFGQPGGNPQSQNAGGNKPWSIRNSLRYLGAQELDKSVNAATMSEAELAEKLLEPLEKRTPMQIGTARVLAQFMQGKGDAAFIADSTEGKLVQPTTEIPPPKKYNFDKMTDEEAAEVYNQMTGRAPD